MPLIEIVKHYVDPRKNHVIHECSRGRFYHLVGKSEKDQMYLGYSEIDNTDELLEIREAIANMSIYATNDSDIYAECERLASQYNGDNLLPLLLAAAYTGKAEGINQTIKQQ